MKNSLSYSNEEFKILINKYNEVVLLKNINVCLTRGQIMTVLEILEDFISTDYLKQVGLLKEGESRFITLLHEELKKVEQLENILDEYKRKTISRWK